MNVCSYFLGMHMNMCWHAHEYVLILFRHAHEYMFSYLQKNTQKTIRSARIDEIRQVPDYDVSHENGKSLSDTAEVVIEHTEGMGKYLRKLQALVEQIRISPQSL